MTEPSQPEPAAPQEIGIQESMPAASAGGPPVENVPAEPTIPLPPLPPLTTAPVIRTWGAFDVFFLLLLATLCFLLGSFTAGIGPNSDVWMHLATGRMLVNGEYRFGPDPFSFASDPDSPWINHSWLYDLGQYAVYQLGDGAALVIVKALLVVVLLFILLAIRPRDFSPFGAMLLAGLAILVLSPRLMLGPAVISYLLFAATLYLLHRGGALGALPDDMAPSPRALWWLLAVFALWVNVDGWFFLGPLTVLLCLAGHGLEAVLGGGASDPAVADPPVATGGLTEGRRVGLGMLAVVAVLGIAACLVNPFHVRAFTLPAEMGYLFRGLLPASVTSTGEALQSLLRYEPGLEVVYDLFPTIRAAYWQDPAKGFNVAGLAYFLLLSVSLASFLPAGLQFGRPGGAGVSLARLLLWLVVAALSLRQVRMVPWFAIVAGPVAMLNFAEYARWRRRQPGVNLEPVLSPGLARFAVTVMLLVALGLAWPGWLHGRIGVPSRRHVAWQVNVDESPRRAAEALAGLHAQGKAERVFNFNFGFANYCAWFAPGVRCYIDQRLTLFPKRAAGFAKVRAELQSDAQEVLARAKKPGKGEWQELFEEHKVDHVMTQDITLPQTEQVTMMFWLQPWHWQQRYADGQTMVFAWSPAGGFPPQDLTAQANRSAFGAVPGARRPPAEGTEPPMGEPLWWRQYVDGPPPQTSIETMAPYLWDAYFKTVAGSWSNAFFHTWTVSSWSGPAGFTAVAPATVLGPYTLAARLAMVPPVLRARDAGPPAAPLLMIRDARRAVADNRYDAPAYHALFQAYRLQLGVEEHWSNPRGETMQNLRTKLREIQLVTALRNYLDLRPQDWFMHVQFAQLQSGLYQLDTGLEAYATALKELEKRKQATQDRKTLEVIKQIEQEHLGNYQNFEREVKRRRDHYDLKSARFKTDPMTKFRIAVLLPYQFIDAKNKEVTDPRGLGLAQEALKQLLSIASDSVPEAERAELHFSKFRLLLQQGRVAEASQELGDPKAMGPAATEAMLWQAAALGNYLVIEQALADAEKSIPVAVLRAQTVKDVVSLLSLNAAPSWPSLGRHGAQLYNQGLIGTLQGLLATTRQAAHLRTLRGIFTLEQGDTAAAEQHFAEALRIAGPDIYFPDRPIAQRYLELLRAQKR